MFDYTCDKCHKKYGTIHFTTSDFYPRGSILDCIEDVVFKVSKDGAVSISGESTWPEELSREFFIGKATEFVRLILSGKSKNIFMCEDCDYGAIKIATLPSTMTQRLKPTPIRNLIEDYCKESGLDLIDCYLKSHDAATALVCMRGKYFSMEFVLDKQ